MKQTQPANALKQRGGEILLTWVPVIALVGTLVYLIWSFQRGFDITDEGYALLTAANPGSNNVPTNGFYHWYSTLLLQLANGSLFGFRVLGLGLLLITGLFFAIQCMRTIEQTTGNNIRPAARPAWIAFLLLSTVAFYALALPTPNYNMLNLAGVLVTTGSLLRAMNGPGDDNRHRRLWLIITGIGIGFVLWTKWPSGLAMIIVLIPLAVLWPGQTVRQRGGGVICVLVGCCAWLGLNLLLVQSPAETWDLFNRGLVYLLPLGSSHGENVLKRSISQVFEFPDTFYQRYAWVPVVLSTVPFWLVMVAGRTERAKRAISGGVLIVITLMVVGGVYLGDFIGGVKGHGFLFMNASAWLLFWSVMTVLLLVGLRHPGGSGVRLLFPLLVLIAIPFFFSAGTGNPLTWTASGAVVGLFAACGLIASLLGDLLRQSRIPTAGIAGMSVVMFGAIITTSNSPYRLAGSLWKQTIPVQIDPAGHEILVDPITAESLKTLRDITQKHGFQTGDDVLGFMSVPGLVYALGANSPGAPWFFGGYSGSVSAAEYALSTVPTSRAHDAWMLLTDRSGMTPIEIEQLTSRPFPDGYQFLGQVPWPVDRQMIQIWKPTKTNSASIETKHVRPVTGEKETVINSKGKSVSPFSIGGLHGSFQLTSNDDGFSLNAVSPADTGAFILQLQLDDDVFNRDEIKGPTMVVLEGNLLAEDEDPYNPALFIQEQVGSTWYRRPSRLPGRTGGVQHRTWRVIEPGDTPIMLGLTWAPEHVGEILQVEDLRVHLIPLYKRAP